MVIIAGVYWSVVRAEYPTGFGGIGQNRERGGLGCTHIGGRTVGVVAVHNRIMNKGVLGLNLLIFLGHMKVLAILKNSMRWLD